MLARIRLGIGLAQLLVASFTSSTFHNGNWCFREAQCEVGQNPPLYLIGTAAGGLGMPVTNLGVHCPGHQLPCLKHVGLHLARIELATSSVLG